jgi:hypothetical protein
MLEGSSAFGSRWIGTVLLPVISVLGAGTASAAEEKFHLHNVWEEHPAVTAGVVFAVLVQSVLITALLVSRRRGRMAEESLRLSEERYREVVESQSELPLLREEARGVVRHELPQPDSGGEAPGDPGDGAPRDRGQDGGIL